MSHNLSAKSVNAVKWNTIAQFNGYFLKFTLGVILARLLSPEEFGLIALITVITEIANFLIDGGFSGSLIQNEKVDNTDFSTIFYVNLGIGVFFTLLFFFGAPLFVKFYNEPRLDSIARILSFVYLFNSVSVVQKAYFIRAIDFKRISIIQMINQTSSGLLGIGLAFAGFGYWTLVWKRFFEALSQAVLYFYFSGWRPDWFFSVKLLKKHWKFSSYILLNNIIQNISKRIDLILVGKFFEPAQLGLYSRGKGYAQLPVTFSSSVINRVSFTAFSRIKNDKQKFINAYDKSSRIISQLILPVLLLLILIADNFITVLIGEKWSGAVPFLKLFSFYGIFYVLKSIRINAISALGHSKVVAILTLFVQPVKIFTLIICAIFLNIEPLIYGYIIIAFAFFEYIYTAFILGQKLNHSFWKVLLNNKSELFISALSFSISYFIFQEIHLKGNLLEMIVQIILFTACFSFLTLLFNKSIAIEIKKLIFNHKN